MDTIDFGFGLVMVFFFTVIYLSPVIVPSILSAFWLGYKVSSSKILWYTAALMIVQFPLVALLGEFYQDRSGFSYIYLVLWIFVPIYILLPLVFGQLVRKLKGYRLVKVN
jgi:hypothetical protein